MRVLVIGGSGYIGSHAARQLRCAGHEVTIYDNLSTGHPRLAKGFPLITADIRDRDALLGALKSHDAVMHFAAHAYVGESVENPRKYFDNNARAALGLFEAVLDAGVKYVVFSSTCAVYGVPAVLPITENTVPDPVNPYGASKLFCEQVLRGFSQAYGLKYAALRYFNAAGADDSGEIGEIHDPETHLIPLALRAATPQGPALQLRGTDYPTADGTCVRDYIHVNDLADAHVRALDFLVARNTCLTANLGTGHGYSIREVLDVVQQVVGRKVNVEMGPRRPGDPPTLVADSAHAAAVLGWRPKYDMTRIIETAWKYHCRMQQ